uniref:Uncharacterized protein n=1 Tax=Arundo donax TaxID=35708 RepID=A0A0A9GWS9_ARUDO
MEWNREELMSVGSNAGICKTSPSDLDRDGDGEGEWNRRGRGGKGEEMEAYK